jgi:hypothetical protein
MISIVDTQTAYDTSLFMGNRREKRLHGQHSLSEGSGSVKCGGACDLVCLDFLMSMCCFANYNQRAAGRQHVPRKAVDHVQAGREEDADILSREVSIGWPRWICDVSAATNRMRRVQAWNLHSGELD